MIDVGQLRTLIVEPVLIQLDLFSPVAVNLLLGTAAQESRMGQYIKQIGKGPALGIYQIEPATHNDIWKNYLAYKPALADRVKKFAIMNPDADEMVGNMYYSTAMARVHYLRVRSPLPADANDVQALARYWKLWFNTMQGRGTVEEFVRNYEKYVA